MAKQTPKPMSVEKSTANAVSGAIKTAACALVVVVAALASACSDEVQRDGDQAVQSAAEPVHMVKWLELSTPISPAQWLASRGAAQAKPLSDPEVQRISATLALAHTRYRESERMIANRSAQLSDMLAGIAINESASAILDDLATLGGETGQTEGYGSLTQHYFNLRSSGTSRADALNTLKTRYGARS